jgi:hypothetical protein
VLRFGDHAVEDVCKKIDPLISRDNPNGPRVVGTMRLRNAPLLAALGLISRPDEMRLTVRDQEGKVRSVDLPADCPLSSRRLWDGLPAGWKRFVDTVPWPLPLYLRDQHTDYWFEYLRDDKTVYWQFNHVRDNEQEPLARFSARVHRFVMEHDVEKLVIDMRWNNGGNSDLLPPLLFDIVRDTKLSDLGKFFVITGNRTFSAAQNFATMIERYANAIIAGDTTGSSPNFVGEDVPLELPYSGLNVSLSNRYWQFSWPTDHRVWIPPLLYAPPTFEAFRAGRDPALELVLAYPRAGQTK